MRALVISEFGPINSHRVVEVPAPQIGEDDVLIEVRAIGLNFPDVLMVQGKYHTRPDRPFVAGRDAAGIVTAVGSKVTRVRTGDRVMAQVFSGAFAEQLAAPQARCFAMPVEMPFVEGAAMLTAYHAAHVAVVACGGVQPGETVLVTGASGGVGLAAVQIARAKGAQVLAGVTSKDKGAIALAAGAAHLIDLSAPDLRECLRQQVYALTDGKGVNVVVDPVGGDVFDAAMRALAYAGRMVVVGFASGRIPEAKAHHVLYQNISVIGAPIDIRFKMEPQAVDATFSDLFAMYRQGHVKPEVMINLPLERIQEAMHLIADRKVKGRIVLTPGKA